MKASTNTVRRHADPTAPDASATALRTIVFRTRGSQHGPIVRLVSPSDLGERIKPFVFLDHARIEPSSQPLFGMHPHSGIATVTLMLSGAVAYEDTTGKSGLMSAGAVEWMKAGNGVWHDGHVLAGEPARVFQLWIALPPVHENAPAESRYVLPSVVPEEAPVRVILGSFGRATSPIPAPAGINYLHVRLKDGERWRYLPPAGHTVAWLAIDQGSLRAPERIEAGEFALFDDSTDGAIEVLAEGDTSFVIGSAIKHPHPLVLGRYSVHTNAAALARGEAEIARIGRRLQAEGRR